MRSGRARRPPLRAVELQHPAACIEDGGASSAICPTSEGILSREGPAHGALVARPSPPKREETPIFDDGTAALAILDGLLHHAAVVSIHQRQLPHALPPRRNRQPPT